MEKLKPCPFCGGEAEIMCLSTVNEHGILSKVFVITCKECGLRNPKAFRIFAQIHNDGICVFDESEKKEAIEAWNRRVKND